jgi:tetratricopeptide (TPR) repeat protein
MSSTSPDKVVSDLIARCEASLTSKNFEEAIDGCRAVLSVAPENQRAKELLEEAQGKLEAELFVRENLRRAREYFQLRDFQKCVNECQKVQLLDHDNYEASELLKQAQGKVEAEPFILNFINSGQSLSDSGLFDEAFAQWEKVRSIDPDYPGLDDLVNKVRQKMVGHASADDRRLQELKGQKTSAVGAPPTFGAAPAEEDVTAEISSEEFSALSDEDKIQHLLKQGDRAFEAGQYQKAIEVWSEIFMLDVNHAEALQKIEQARSQASEQRSKVVELLKEAQSAYDQGQITKARDLFFEVRELDPGNGQAEKYLGLIDGAEGGPATLEDLIVMGTAAENKGHYREAAQYYSQALAVDPENADLADRIKNLNMLAKKQEQGKTVLGNAKAFLAEGKVDSARHAITKILEGDPENKEALELMKEIKTMGAANPSTAMFPTAGAPATTISVAKPKKGIPLIPVAIAAAVLLGGVLYYFLFLRAKDEPVKRLHIPQKGTTRIVKNATIPKNNLNPHTNLHIVSPEAREKATKLVQESQFYFMEKHYPEALDKAEQALAVDPENKDAKDLKRQCEKNIADEKNAERKVLEDANTYFGYSEFAGAVKLYERYLDKHPEAKAEIDAQIVKCYYNMGVIAIRQWRCDIAGDYFRQVLFIDKNDPYSNDALNVARRCQQTGSGDLEVRKSVSMLEIRK